MKKLAKNVAAILLGFLIAGWSIWQYQEAQVVSTWANLYSAKNYELVQLADAQSLPETFPAYLKLALIYANDRFPPDHDKALAYYTQAAANDPLNSVVWYRIAREKAVMGRTEEARRALKRSDTLDPYFPNNRMASIQLWSVLDEPEHSLEVAKSLGKLGGRYQLGASQQLAAVGLTPLEIFDAMELSNASAPDQLGVIKAVRTDDPAEMKAVLDRIKWDELGDTEIRNLAVAVASRPLNYETAVKVWRIESKALVETPAWVLDNPRLVVSPFDKEFDLGWQRFPDQAGLEYRWLSPEGGDDLPHGTVIVTFNHRGKDIQLNWVLYRFLLAPNSEVNAILKLRQRPAKRIAAGVQLRVLNGTGGNSKVDAPEQGWSRFPVRCATGDQPSIVEVRLLAAPLDGEFSDSHTLELEIGGIEVSSAGDTPESAEVSK